MDHGGAQDPSDERAVPQGAGHTDAEPEAGDGHDRRAAGQGDHEVAGQPAAPRDRGRQDGFGASAGLLAAGAGGGEHGKDGCGHGEHEHDDGQPGVDDGAADVDVGAVQAPGESEGGGEAVASVCGAGPGLHQAGAERHRQCGGRGGVAADAVRADQLGAAGLLLQAGVADHDEDAHQATKMAIQLRNSWPTMAPKV